ncbi:type III secretion system inner rod subunit SctI [Aeromonas salmonicida]|uniref:type III secretion system inner rod subunit SctI n=1 Tax=Aeromonas salmonicida TaxID=645 RepID=UPI00259DE3EC|nr:type III secretion system inner rod subunit SctI [Aeromonas salmonicida]MDM5065367.1 type III secretion system inner rod subunit SctI [Aeromonas salmonicida]
MTIDATTLTATQAVTEHAVSAIPSASEIDAFTQMLFGHQASTPEEIAATGLQEKSHTIGQAIENARASADVLNNPDTMLKAQSALKNATVEVDLIAKTAGLLSQGVNKLVSMQ